MRAAVTTAGAGRMVLKACHCHALLSPQSHAREELETHPPPQGQPSTQSSLLWLKRMGRRGKGFPGVSGAVTKDGAGNAGRGKSSEGGMGVTQHLLMNPAVLHALFRQGRYNIEAVPSWKALGISREGALWCYISRTMNFPPHQRGSRGTKPPG